MPYIGSAVSKSTDIKRITFATTTTGSGPFALGWTPASENTLRVTINGVVQQDSSISLSGSDLSLVGVSLVSGDELEVQGIVDVGGLSGIPADGTVTEGKIGGGAVTAAKIGSGAVGTSAIASGAVGASEIAANSITVAQMARAGTSGQLLTSAGTGSDATWSDAPAGGLTTASQWRVTADFTGDAQPIGDSTGAIAIVDSNGYGSLGSAMTYGSGVFAFPSTGFWLCLGQFTFTSTLTGNVAAYLEYTANNGGAWATASRSEDGSNYGYRSNVNIYHMMDITDTANQKVRWSVDADPAGSGGTITTRGDASVTETGFTFIKLA